MVVNAIVAVIVLMMSLKAVQKLVMYLTDFLKINLDKIKLGQALLVA